LSKEIFAVLAIALTVCGYFLYARSVLKRRTKPHMFTWMTWALINGITFAGQLASNAGAGSWSFAVSSALCVLVAALSLFFGEKNITRSDGIFFCLGLAAIPVWLLTNDPLGALALVSFISLTGSLPTFRKSYADPYGENLMAWSVHGFRAFLVVLATENYSLTTLIAPVSGFLINAGIPVVLALGRFTRRKATKPV
jgi:hypothetical protein